MVPLKSHGFFWLTFVGEVSLGKLARAHEAYMTHPDFEPGIDELLDFSNASIRNISKRDIELIWEFMKERTDLHTAKSVYVVNTQLEYGLGRMLGGYLGVQAPSERGIFYSIEEALEWLRPEQGEEILAAYEAALPDAGRWPPQEGG